MARFFLGRLFYGALPSTAYTIVFGALFLLPWLQDAATEFVQASSLTMIAVAGLAIFPTLVAYLAWNFALGKLPAGVAANFIYLMAPLATFLAFVFLGDEPPVATVVGGLMTMLGTIIVARWETPHRKNLSFPTTSAAPGNKGIPVAKVCRMRFRFAADFRYSQSSTFTSGAGG